MVDLRKVTCKRCNKEVSLDEARYSDARNLLCLDCFNKQYPDRKIQPDLKKPVSKPSLKENATLAEPPAYISYECLKCGYNFSMKTETVRAKRCPYCSGENIQKAKKAHEEIDELIHEASGKKYDS